MLALLTVVSLPLARRIAMPIDKLVEAAQRLGSGDSRLRTGITRRGDIGELARTFDEMAGRIEKLLRSEKELLANISHELRTPLARMRVALELAAEGDSAAARRYLGEVTTDITELERLVDDVMTTARFSDLAYGDGSLPPLRREKVPSATLQEAAARFTSSRPGRHLEVSVAEGTPELLAVRASPAPRHRQPAGQRRQVPGAQLPSRARPQQRATPVTPSSPSAITAWALRRRTWSTCSRRSFAVTRVGRGRRGGLGWG